MKKDTVEKLRCPFVFLWFGILGWWYNGISVYRGFLKIVFWGKMGNLGNLGLMGGEILKIISEQNKISSALFRFSSELNFFCSELFDSSFRSVFRYAVIPLSRCHEIFAKKDVEECGSVILFCVSPYDGKASGIRLFLQDVCFSGAAQSLSYRGL